LKLSRNVFVLIADGSRARIAQNVGTALAPRLHVRSSLKTGKIPPTRRLARDKPGRVHESASTRRSSVEPTDLHALAEERFLRRMASTLQRLHQTKELEKLIIVAPPRALATLRDILPDSVREKIVAEINKDLTGLSLENVEQHLAEL
jgi:protein required for attachment to host cells